MERTRHTRTSTEAWPALVRKFLAEEWLKVPAGVVLGFLLVALQKLLVSDAVFRSAVAKRWQESSLRTTFSGLSNYRVELAGIFAVVTIIVLALSMPLIAKIINSWVHGIVSGLSVLWAFSFSYYFSFGLLTFDQKLTGAVVLGFCFSILSVALHLNARIEQTKTILIEPLLSPPSRRNHELEEHLSDLDGDSPIQEWSEDLLGRFALVDSLATTILVSQAPVIAVEGEYGDGKSSVLNLLRKRLSGHAIVVTFRTWLPGSEETLARDLFSDISSECRRLYYVPQLRSRLLNYAKRLSGSVSFLKDLTGLFQEPSQRQEIAEVGEALRRIPRRIVVLLDEIDRMQAEELRVLLKIIRGVTSFPNLCYVCAFSRTAIEKICPKETTEGLEGYYDKFFPVSFLLPKPEPDLLFRVLQAKLERIFNSLDWFDVEEDRTKFQKRMKDAWEDVLVKLFTNLRKITLVVNDVSVAAIPIAREVNAFDLFLMESLRRFFPEVYKQVWQNAEAFMETNLSWGSRLYSEERVKAAKQEALGRLIKELQATPQSRLAGDLLWWMFPSFATQFRQGLGWQRKKLTDNPEVAEAEKRIFHEDFFPIYFRYQAPESLYSETELRKFANAMNSAGTLEERKSLYKKTLSAIPKADPRRYSFMHRLLQSVGRLNDAAAEALSYAVAENASEYIYDSILPSVAEAGRGMLIVFTVAQRFAKTSKVQEILEKSIFSATDDTFALRLLTFSTESRRNKILTDHSNVRPDGLKHSFIQRMRKRYVDDFDALDTSLAQADRDAFVLWAQYSEEERSAEIGFWRRFVGNDRKRLARLADILLPRGVLWETDPRPHIEKLFPLSEFEKLENKLAGDEPLEDAETKALGRMRRLISGEFQNGVTHEDLRDF